MRSFLLTVPLIFTATHGVIAVPSRDLDPGIAALAQPGPSRLHAPSRLDNTISLHHQDDDDLWPSTSYLYKRSPDGDHHHSGPPKTELNETELLMHHKPTPDSYAIHDFEDHSVEHKYPGLMILHATLMSIAFFGALPAGIALRSVNHVYHGLSVIVFYVLVGLGVASSMLYSKLTPNMYEGSQHGTQGYVVLFIAQVLTGIDTLAQIQRVVRFLLAVRAGEQQFNLRNLWRVLAVSREEESSGTYGADAPEYESLVTEEPSEIDMDELKLANVQSHQDSQSPVNTAHETENWANDMRQMSRQHRIRGSEWRVSVASDGTLFHPQDSPVRHAHPLRKTSGRSQHSEETLNDPRSPLKAAIANKEALLRKTGRIAFATTERVLVFMGYAQMLSGMAVYTGICRDSYINVCLAHLIKGGIFWCYGLVSFARFLGSFSELGWAWNLSPRSDTVSAEFVESLVIFVYGITNTWMERFDVPAGSPFTTKQVQHISIAVMFWFAGLVGMGIESKRVRRWLATTAAASSAPAPESQESITVSEPKTYTASFNPFPALVIGVTGIAMAAHAQTYVFQVQIHTLWGLLLGGFAVLRCLTYFFLWLGPPSSVLPSRPPTEAMASFFLACGGLMFQFSTEEISIAAMRRKHDDQMMFLNVAVAITCLAFCWVLSVVAFKGWLKTRASPRVIFRNSA